MLIRDVPVNAHMMAKNVYIMHESAVFHTY